MFQETGNITCTEFLPVDPYFLASTCSNRVNIYICKLEFFEFLVICY